MENTTFETTRIYARCELNCPAGINTCPFTARAKTISGLYAEIDAFETQINHGLEIERRWKLAHSWITERLPNERFRLIALLANGKIDPSAFSE